MRKRWLLVVDEAYKHPAISKPALPPPGANIVPPHADRTDTTVSAPKLPFTNIDIAHVPNVDVNGMLHELQTAPTALRFFELLDGDQHALQKIYEMVYKSGVTSLKMWIEEKWLWNCYQREDAFFELHDTFKDAKSKAHIWKLLEICLGVKLENGITYIANSQTIDTLLRLAIYFKICEVTLWISI